MAMTPLCHHLFKTRGSGLNSPRFTSLSVDCKVHSFFLPRVCVCACVCMHTCQSVLARVPCRGIRYLPRLLSASLPPVRVSHRTRSSLFHLDWLASELSEPASFYPPVLGLYMRTAMPGFSCRYGDLNSGSHAPASTQLPLSHRPLTLLPL